MSLPPGYRTIADAKPRKGEHVSIIGVAIDFRPPMQSRGTDFMCSFSVCDQSAALSQSSFLVRLFRPNPDDLPQSVEISDDAIIVVVFREIKVMTLPSITLGVSSRYCQWVICQGSIPPPKKKNRNFPPQRPKIRVLACGPAPVEDPEQRSKLLSEAEYDACKDLVEFWHSRGRLAGCHGVNQETFNKENVKEDKKRKLALIKDIQLDSFHDIICFVQKTWSSSSSLFTITVTDFTENLEIHPQGDNLFGEPEVIVRDESYSYAYEAGGVTKNHNKTRFDKQWYEKPFGQYSLRVACWDRLAAKAQNEIREGSYVVLKNVRIKYSANKQLEGAISDMRRGRDAEEGFVILQPNDAKLKGLHTRRNELIRTLKARRDEIMAEGKRKEEEAQKKRMESEMKRRQDNNPLVHCGYKSMETTTIDKILNMLDGMEVEFVNRRYRTECRVMDFRPSELEDFCRPVGSDTDACAIDPSRDVVDGTGDTKPHAEWYWCFEFDVVGKDGVSFLTIQVDDQAGRYLLTPEPCNLRDPANNTKLRQLRQELFTLWGNLEEVKLNRRERLVVCENNVEKLLQQYKNGPQDNSFLEKQFAQFKQQKEEILRFPIFEDPSVSNKYFFAMVKEYGERDEEDEVERKFLLESTTISKARIEKEKQNERS